MNGQVEVTWQTLRTISHSIMVHTQVSDKYIQFSFMYTTDNIFLVLTIKHLVNQDGKPTTLNKLETGTKPSESNPRLLFFPNVVQRATAHVDTKALKMCHKPQNNFVVSFLEYHNIKKGASFAYLLHGM